MEKVSWRFLYSIPLSDMAGATPINWGYINGIFIAILSRTAMLAFTALSTGWRCRNRNLLRAIAMAWQERSVGGMWLDRNNPKEFVVATVRACRVATIPCRNVTPDLWGRGYGAEIGAAHSLGVRKRPRF